MGSGIARTSEGMFKVKENGRMLQFFGTGCITVSNANLGY